MNVLITGGAGYIGSQLIRDAAHICEKVIVLDNMSRECYHSLMGLPSTCEYELIQGDIRNREVVERALEHADTVIHLAALTNAPESFERRDETREINYEGSLTVLEGCIKYNVRKLIYASTTSVYGQTQGTVDETYTCNPVSPYALYKLKAEQDILERARKNGISAVALRLATVYGYSPGIRFHTVLNKFVFLACTGMPLTIYGTGEQKRPFLHVKDASRALLFCIEKDLENDVYNVVGSNASVNDIVQCIRKKYPDVKTTHVEREILNQISYSVNASKIGKIGFNPEHGIDAEIEELMTLFNVFFEGEHL